MVANAPGAGPRGGAAFLAQNVDLRAAALDTRRYEACSSAWWTPCSEPRVFAALEMPTGLKDLI